MKDLLLYMAQNLVDYPDEITINEVEKDDLTVYQLHVAPTDMGKVIGRQGKIAKEIRVIMKNVGQSRGKRVVVDIID